MPYKNLSFTERRIKQIYEGMRQRCRYPKMHSYEHYGGRGIDVCEEWKRGWRVFYEWAINNGYSDNLTLDRIDVNGNYCPENCRWATKKEQNNNTRRNRLLTYMGRTQNLGQWCEELGLSRSRVTYRLNCGLTVEEAFNMPSIRGKRRRINHQC